MENKYKVRIMRSEIRNIKNVAYGDVMYMNYGSINKKAMCDKTDIVGIYGQNGSGKTALVESLDMLRQILTGSPINYEMYEGILSKDGTSCIRTEFFVWIGEEKYKAADVDEEERLREISFLEYEIKEIEEADLKECNNEEVKQENSNKNPTVNSVQRDYMAGEVSKDITKRFLLPPDIVDAHEQGLIHFHDADYFAQHMHNCCLVNLEDMLQNGTVISETMIEKPHSFSTACNIATQAIAQIASSQYGGQSISLAHLAPFVQVSREKFIGQVRDEFDNDHCFRRNKRKNLIEFFRSQGIPCRIIGQRCCRDPDRQGQPLRQPGRHLLLRQPQRPRHVELHPHHLRGLR